MQNGVERLVGHQPMRRSNPFVAAMVQLQGQDKTRKWLLGMKNNNAKEYPKNTPAVLAVSRGEIDVALVNHYYLYRLKQEHGDQFPVANHYFRSSGADSMVNFSGIGILNTAKNREPAAALVRYLLAAKRTTSLCQQQP